MRYTNPCQRLSGIECTCPIDIVILCYKLSQETIQERMSRFVHSSTGLSVRWLVYDNTEHNWNIHKVWNHLIGDSKYWVNLNPDTFPHLGWLDRIIEVMEKVPMLAACGPSSDHTYNEQANRSLLDLQLVPRGSWVPGTLPSGFACVYRTDVLKLLGGFREDFDFYGGDLDLCIRMRHAGFQTGWCVPAFVGHTWGESAKQESSYLTLRELGNTQLQAAQKQYSRRGVWRHENGEVFYAEEGPPLRQETAEKGQE